MDLQHYTWIKFVCRYISNFFKLWNMNLLLTYFQFDFRNVFHWMLHVYRYKKIADNAMDVNLHICVTYVLNHDAAIWVSDLTKNNFIFVTSTIYVRWHTKNGFSSGTYFNWTYFKTFPPTFKCLNSLLLSFCLSKCAYGK